jgi:hypothetical protein
MHGPTCIFWANLTPFSLQYPQLHNVLGVLRERAVAYNLMVRAADEGEEGGAGGRVHVYIWPRQNQSAAGRFQMAVIELCGWGVCHSDEEWASLAAAEFAGEMAAHVSLPEAEFDALAAAAGEAISAP